MYDAYIVCKICGSRRPVMQLCKYNQKIMSMMRRYSIPILFVLFSVFWWCCGVCDFYYLLRYIYHRLVPICSEIWSCAVSYKDLFHCRISLAKLSYLVLLLSLFFVLFNWCWNTWHHVFTFRYLPYVVTEKFHLITETWFLDG